MAGVYLAQPIAQAAKALYMTSQPDKEDREEAAPDEGDDGATASESGSGTVTETPASELAEVTDAVDSGSGDEAPEGLE
jgi:hypothetical protein